MHLQKKPNRWSCSITALAMALETPVVDIIKEARHDGGEIIFPHLNEPMCRKGFHSQELVRIAWLHGFAMTPLEMVPVIRSTTGTHLHPVWDLPEGKLFKRFRDVLLNTWGIVEGSSGQSNHTLHYDNGTLYDPDGYTYKYSREGCESRGFYANRLWVFTRYTPSVK